VGLVRIAIFCALAAATLAAPSRPANAAPREVLCESKHYRHAYCPTGPHGSVHVMEVFGRSNCTEGSTWGTDSGGIWVDQGCYARFRVEDPGSSSHHGDRAAAAGAIGAVVIAAILASSSHDRDTAPPAYAPAAPPPPSYAPPPPSYAPNAMIGRFSGYDSVHRAEITVDIEPSGRVQYYALGQHVAGNLQGNRIYYQNSTSYAVEPTPTGFVLRQDGDPANAVTFQRAN